MKFQGILIEYKKLNNNSYVFVTLEIKNKLISNQFVVKIEFQFVFYINELCSKKFKYVLKTVTYVLKYVAYVLKNIAYMFRFVFEFKVLKFEYHVPIKTIF